KDRQPRRRLGRQTERKHGGLGKLGSLATALGKIGGAKAGGDGASGNLNKLASLAGNFGRVRTLGGFINAASPLLKYSARVAAPMVGTVIAGPLGGLAGKLLLQMLKGRRI